ncbi:MAG: ABC transporter ATP-binding protein/permease [Defluviitaleaceae bacterium]|nr:ABC transporter ATP-binding protein/permease [Defluviitaleaceae bacterium]
MKLVFNVMLKGPKNKVMLFVYFILSFGIGFLMLQSNSLLGQVFNLEFLAQDIASVLPSFLLVVFLFALTFCISNFKTYLSQKLIWDCNVKIKEYFILKLLKSNNNYFHDKPAPGVWSKLLTSASNATNAFLTGIDGISYFIKVIFLGIVVFSIDFYAGVFSIIAMPLYFVATKGFGSSFMEIQAKTMENNKETSIFAEEAINGVSNVKTKNAYGFFTDRIMKLQHINARLFRKMNVSQVVLSSIGSFFNILAPIVVVFLVMQFSDADNINAGGLVVLFINVPQFVGAFAGLNNVFINFASFKPGIEHIKELIAVPEEPNGNIVINDFEYLESKDVSVQYGNRIINVPDLRINKGERVMFMGESGIGKSTLLNIVMGILHDYKGDVIVNGINLKDIELYSLRNVFGIALQNTNVATLTLKDNILLGIKGVSNKLDEAISLSELKMQYEEKGEQILNSNIMSGGEKSRLGLAQLLVRDYDIILIDETFSSIDEDMESLIIERLFSEYPDKTFVCISHRASSKRFFDRVIDFGE